MRSMMTVLVFACRGIPKAERDAILMALTEAVGEVPEPTAKQSPQGAKSAVAQGTAVPCCIILSKV